MLNEKRHCRIERADVVASINRRDAWIVSGCANVDFLNPRACNGAAQEGGVQRIDQWNVVDEGAFATQQFWIDIAFNAGAEGACRHTGFPSGAAEKLAGPLHRRDDVDVAGAATKVARK